MWPITEADWTFRVPDTLWLWAVRAAHGSSLGASQRFFHHFWARGCWGRRLQSALLIRRTPYLLDNSLLMMALTGRIELRSFLCCSIRHDCADTERWEAGGLWITHSWPTAAYGKKENMNGAQLSGVSAYLNKLSLNGIELELLVDCPGDIIPFKWLWNTKSRYTPISILNKWGHGLLFTLAAACSASLKCLPSTHMYLFLHSWELVLGKALASRTEITCLSHLWDRGGKGSALRLKMKTNKLWTF